MIARVDRSNIQDFADLALKLWPDSTREELERDFDVYISSSNDAVFIARAEEGAVGFAHCSLRVDYVPGAESSPAGYLEGIFVENEHRRKGYARTLVDACEQWATDKGCSDFASDCLLDNHNSIEMHQHLGFTEVERTVSFYKKL
ncbi:GNAT family N-acetyltransferase [Salinicoccus cyprini]|uniref:Aminoglycoside N(6')-acetyltransferase type 1 n=1 Tax=Salinicoccus cyprini TaxID=2493691 RepID=A0A558AYT5_9STAP|nr:aminoglycoside 6'-N-acetyltransferase [Salinicoccus cyprini]TVT29428.1 GNAT family N-acetyltransferase [Salinicoccus cyprini]